MADTTPLFLRACRRENTSRPPVWMMRQAGRYMPEYRKIRANKGILEIARDPALAAEVTLQPIRRFGMDAAILFTDLLIGFPAMGLDFEFAKGEGPKIYEPVRTGKDLARLKALDPEKDLPYLLESVERVKADLPDDTPLIGFAGAPFTLASYAIEGGPSRHFIHTKRLMQNDPSAFRALMDLFAEASAALWRGQRRTGVDALQIFDSWVGALSPDDYREHLLEPTAKVFDSVRDVPRIHFGTGTSTLLELQAEAGGDVIGVDWRVPLEEAFRRFPDKAIQGNLDPIALLGDWPPLERKVRKILETSAGRPGHIFNLGHGILPETDPETVAKVVSLVQHWNGA